MTEALVERDSGMGGSYWKNVLTQQHNRRRLLAMAGGATAASLIAACGGGKLSSNANSGEQTGLATQAVDTTSKAKRSGLMKDRQFADPPTLDILTLNNPWYSPGYAVYNSLVQSKPGYLKPGEFDYDPDLAESWASSPDGLQITLKVRPNIKFHNK